METILHDFIHILSNKKAGFTASRIIIKYFKRKSFVFPSREYEAFLCYSYCSRIALPTLGLGLRLDLSEYQETVDGVISAGLKNMGNYRLCGKVKELMQYGLVETEEINRLKG